MSGTLRWPHVALILCSRFSKIFLQRPVDHASPTLDQGHQTVQLHIGGPFHGLSVSWRSLTAQASANIERDSVNAAVVRLLYVRSLLSCDGNMTARRSPLGGNQFT